MKNLIILVLTTTLSTFLITGCEFSDDGDQSYTPETSTLNGKWTLTNIKGGLKDINQNYNPGDISWTFNSKGARVIIENNLTSNDVGFYNSLPTGNYNYSLYLQAITNYISIDDDEIGLAHINKDILIIDENKKSYGSEPNGYILTFNR